MSPVSIFDRYLLRQLVTPFLVALVAMLLALLLERLLVLFNHLASSNSKLGTFASLLADLLPHYLGLALPAALTIAVFMAISRMNDHHELDVLQSGHMSLLRISQPYIAVGILIGVIGFFLYGYLQPLARYDYREAFYLALHTGWAPHLQSNLFAQTSSHHLVTADRVSHAGSKLKNIFILEPLKNGGERYITAPKGTLTISEQERATRLDLQNGEIIELVSPHAPGSQIKITLFQHLMRILDRQAKIDPFRSRGDDERELTTLELLSAIRHHSTSTPSKALQAELGGRMARAIALPFLPLLAIALAINGKRTKGPKGQILLAAILIGFDEILIFGQNFAESGALPVTVGVWLPLLCFCGICVFCLMWVAGLKERLSGLMETRRKKENAP